MFSDPFSLSSIKENSLYAFNDTYHLIYCILHFAHHLRNGAGIRYMLDFYYMFKKTNIDFELLHKAIKDLKIEKLYYNIINVLFSLFEVSFDNTFRKNDVAFFISYMLSYGIHGHSNQIIVPQHKHKLKYFFIRVFLLNKEYRLSSYPKLGNWYFFPFCLLLHWTYLFTHKMGSLFKFLFGKNKNKHLYKKLGV